MVRILIATFLAITLLVSGVGIGVQADDARAVFAPSSNGGIEIWLDRETYEAGENLTIHFRSDHAGYVTVYDFMPNGNVVRVFPNQYRNDNKVLAEVEYTLPSSQDPFKLTVSVPSQTAAGAREILWIVITEETLALPDADGIPAYEFALRAFNDLANSGGWWASDMCEFSYGDNPSPQPEPPEDEDFALVIGINDYIDDWVPSPDNPAVEMRFPKLRGCVPDARAIADTLRSGYEHVKVIIDSNATYTNIQQAMTDWLATAGPNSRVLIYYSGHGATQVDINGDEEDGQDETLVPYNWADERRFIIDDEISEWIEELQAKKILLIIDSCHSGTIADIAKGLSGIQARTYQVSYLDRGYLSVSQDRSIVDSKPGTRSFGDERTVIALEACGAEESAYETSLEGSYHGLFTYFNLQALQDMSTWPSASAITARDLFKYASKKVTAITREWREDDSRVRLQHPTLEASSGVQDIVILTKE